MITKHFQWDFFLVYFCCETTSVCTELTLNVHQVNFVWVSHRPRFVLKRLSTVTITQSVRTVHSVLLRKVRTLLKRSGSHRAGVDPHRLPSFYGNRSDFSELLRNRQKGTLKIKIYRTFRKGAHLEGSRCFGNRSPFILDPRL